MQLANHPSIGWHSKVGALLRSCEPLGLQWTPASNSVRNSRVGLLLAQCESSSPRYSRSHLSIVFAFCHSIPYSLFLSVSFSIQSNPSLGFDSQKISHLHHLTSTNSQPYLALSCLFFLTYLILPTIHLTTSHCKSSCNRSKLPPCNAHYLLSAALRPILAGFALLHFDDSSPLVVALISFIIAFVARVFFCRPFSIRMHMSTTNLLVATARLPTLLHIIPRPDTLPVPSC